METKKMSLGNLIGKMSRNEMKSIMAGSGNGGNGGRCIGSVGQWVGSCWWPSDCYTYCRSHHCYCF